MQQTLTDFTVEKQVKNTGLSRYQSLYLWMLIPMTFMQLGIYRDYWGDFSENAWSVHVHYWTGTIWYLYLIFQPWLATHGRLSSHRTNGIIGMFVAGGVCLTALSMLHRDIQTTDRIIQSPEAFGPLKVWFFMGVAAVEIVMMTAFGFAVIMSIIRRKRVEDHAWWLIATVFIIMMPALGRGIQNVWFFVHRAEWPNVDVMLPIHATNLLIVVMIVLAAYKYNKFSHPATYVAIGVNLFNLLLEPVGKAEWVQSFLRTILKG